MRLTYHKKPIIIKRKRASDVPYEYEEQEMLVEELRLRYPYLLFFHIANGDFRHISTANRLKDCGVRAGVPDLFFPALNLFIELKRQRSVASQVSRSQKYMMKLLREAGYRCEVCYGAKESVNLIKEIMKTRQPNGNAI